MCDLLEALHGNHNTYFYSYNQLDYPQGHQLTHQEMLDYMSSHHYYSYREAPMDGYYDTHRMEQY